MQVPKDAILMLSGVSCVGKTTAAYEIVKNYPEFRRVRSKFHPPASGTQAFPQWNGVLSRKRQSSR